MIQHDTAIQGMVSKYINTTNCSVFLTGKAGTGKTTLLRKIEEHTHKNMVIAAPTGIAAINAGGVTLHSLFQMPFGAFVPDNNSTQDYSQARTLAHINTPRTLLKNLQMHTVKRNLIRQMELLVIDEVSMLRADLLDAIDVICRSVRRQYDVPFGGLQVLFIGDMLQLPPVVKNEEWSYLSKYYPTPYFFDAQVLRNNRPVHIELEKIYRQSDEQFIDVLNHLRDNKVTPADVALLNKYYQPDFNQHSNDGYIQLTTHNAIADRKNADCLAELDGHKYAFNAEVKGDFKEHQYPIHETLHFKKGAQVMFVKNDFTGQQRYFNGKIGKITSINREEIKVSFTDGTDPVWVEPYTWENKKYTLNKETNDVEEKIAGEFKQYHIKLAWAITIHKSQGLTFDKAIIDVGKAFAPGQIYVALSRLTSLDGLILVTPVPTQGISADASLNQFCQGKMEMEALQPLLNDESRRYFNRFVLHAFDINDLILALHRHVQSYTKDEKRSAKQQYKSWAEALLEKTEPLQGVANSFRNQVQRIIAGQQEGYVKHLTERVNKAIAYFQPQIKQLHANVSKHKGEIAGTKGMKKYHTEVSELAAQYYKLSHNMLKAKALLESSIKGDDVNKEDIDKPDLEVQQEETTAKAKKEKANKQPKVATYLVSCALYKQGNDVKAIAQERGLAVTTIETHMARCIKEELIPIGDFMGPSKRDAIVNGIKQCDTTSLTAIREQLKFKYSFTELKYAIAWMEGEDM